MCLTLVPSTETECSEIVLAFHPPFHSKWVISVVVLWIRKHWGAACLHNSQPQWVLPCAVWCWAAHTYSKALGQVLIRGPVCRKLPPSTNYSAFTWECSNQLNYDILLWHISCLVVEMPNRFLFPVKHLDTNLVTFPQVESSMPCLESCWVLRSSGISVSEETWDIFFML